ncbi:glycosyltransferase [Amphibiibacter pelophylacis]|uniref:Glycosyltransferase n=1 Tax=Amphibiibacter pelophylacis TaxID=1799477 RepID=A0ACC6NZ74_9BURK
MISDLKKITLILTCFNEQENIQQLLDDVINLEYKPYEMIVVDAGSTDGTLAQLASYKSKFAAQQIDLHIHIHPKVGIAEGRNLAIGYSCSDLIAVTDAGCRIDSAWLKNITKPLLENKADFVGGFFLPVAYSPLQRALALLTTARRPGRNFMPSSRSVAFRKSVWLKAGKYPEWLQWGEDTLFNKLCLTSGARYEIAADAIVHWEVRRSWQAIAKQFYRYAYGDGLARRVTWSLLSSPLIYFSSILSAIFFSPLWLLIIPLYAVSWPLRRGAFTLQNFIFALGLAALIQFSRSRGYIRGLFDSIKY